MVATEYSADVTCILVTEMRIFSDFKAGGRKIGLLPLLLFHIGLGHLSPCSKRINVKYYCKQIIQLPYNDTIHPLQITRNNCAPSSVDTE